MVYRSRRKNIKQSYSQDIYLITYKEIENDIGEVVNDEVFKRHVMAKETNLSRQDFYQSRVAGLKPTVQIEIKAFEYEGELELEFENERYFIVKTYNIGQDVELTCEKATYDKKH